MLKFLLVRERRLPDLNEEKLDSDSKTILLNKINQLKIEKKELKNEILFLKQKPSGRIGYIFLFFGFIALIVSFISSSYFLAFAGSSLIFWGAIILFITPANYIKSDLLLPSAASAIENVSKIIEKMDYQGKAVYIPCRYFSGSKKEKIFIPSRTLDSILNFKDISEEKIFSNDPSGVFLAPSGQSLTDLFEDELGIGFRDSTLETFQDDLQELLVQNLEIARDVEIEIKGNEIHVILYESIYNNFCQKIRRDIKSPCQSFACPLCSSIACALTRITANPVIIHDIKFSDDDKIIHVIYQVAGEIKKIQPPINFKPKSISYSKTINMNILFAVIGFAIMAFIVWVTWVDITVWHKDLAMIFFEPRTTELIGLGIGLRLVYYLVIALAFFLFYAFGLFTRKSTSFQRIK